MRSKPNNTIRQVVVDCIVFRRQLGEKQLRKIRYSRVLVFQTLGHLAQLTFHFDHAVQDQVSEHHQRILLYNNISVRQAFIKLIAILVDDVAKRNGHVTKSDNDVTTDIWVPGRPKDLEQKVVVLVAKL